MAVYRPILAEFSMPVNETLHWRGPLHGVTVTIVETGHDRVAVGLTTRRLSESKTTPPKVQ
jgi:hypothetical protein